MGRSEILGSIPPVVAKMAKIALDCTSCNFLAILATTREIYPKLHFCS